METAFHAAIAHRRSRDVSHDLWLFCRFVVEKGVVVEQARKRKVPDPWLAGVMQTSDMQGPVRHDPRPIHGPGFSGQIIKSRDSRLSKM